MGEKKDLESQVKEWAEFTCNNYMGVVLAFLFSSRQNRRFMLYLLKTAGIDFKDILAKKTDSERNQSFYDIYEKDYQTFDMWVRFGDELDKMWAMWIKMNTLGMTYDEVLQDSGRRDAWTPLNEKRKGKW